MFLAKNSKSSAVFALGLMAAAVSASVTAAAQPDSVRVIVAFKKGAQQNGKAAIAAAKGSIKEDLPSIDAAAAEVPSKALGDLRNSPHIEFVEEDGRRTLLARNVVNEIKRLPGVGQAQLFGTERAMRVWVDPAKLVGYKLTMADVTAAIRAQNAQVTAGTLGDLPAPRFQTYSAPVVVQGQLTSPEEFGKVVLRASGTGATVRLSDVARIEMAGANFNISARLNGKPFVAIAVQQSLTGNALATAELVRNKMEELSKFFPPGLTYTVPYDTSLFVKISIEEVVKTLLEAVLLVFIVMYGYIITNVQLPPGASKSRTEAVLAKVEEYMAKQPGVARTIAVAGFSFSGNGQNAGLVFVPLKDWSERGAEDSADKIAGRAFGALSGIADAIIFPLSPPPIRELGNATGITARLQDRSSQGHAALVAARNQLLGLAGKSPILAGVRPEGLEDAPQLQVDVDRDKANAQLTARFEHSDFRVARPQRILGLQCSDGVHRMRAAQRGSRHFRQADAADLARAHQVGQRAHTVFNGHTLVPAVQVVQVNHIGLQTAQAHVVGNHHQADAIERLLGRG
eukprot:gene30494-37719_t